MSIKVYDKITYSKLQWCNRQCLGISKWFNPTLYNVCNNLGPSMLGLQLSQYSKMIPRFSLTFDWCTTNSPFGLNVWMEWGPFNCSIDVRFQSPVNKETMPEPSLNWTNLAQHPLSTVKFWPVNPLWPGDYVIVNPSTIDVHTSITRRSTS